MFSVENTSYPKEKFEIAFIFKLILNSNSKLNI